jgi:hypothetical protein
MKMKEYLRNRILEIIGFVINATLISKFFFDKITIRCEPCFSSDCPPCQTEYMKNIWIYLIGFNLLFAIALVLKNYKSK